MLVAVAVVLAYLAGSIPFGVVFAKARGIDLRQVGSGNIGATNAARALGKGLGILVFLCDAAKGWLPTLLARQLLAPVAGPWAVAAVGAAAFIGHLAPPWLGFRGGKGVATAFGVFLAISPPAALAAGAVFAVLYATTRIASIGSLAAATLVLPALYLLGAPPASLALAGFMWLLIVWKHRGNIGRLLRREESKV
jgi:glycerol-3-phosphate acyltransferase PlsY